MHAVPVLVDGVHALAFVGHDGAWSEVLRLGFEPEPPTGLPESLRTKYSTSPRLTLVVGPRRSEHEIMLVLHDQPASDRSRPEPNPVTVAAGGPPERTALRTAAPSLHRTLVASTAPGIAGGTARTALLRLALRLAVQLLRHRVVLRIVAHGLERLQVALSNELLNVLSTGSCSTMPIEKSTF